MEHAPNINETRAAATPGTKNSSEAKHEQTATPSEKEHDASIVRKTLFLFIVSMSGLASEQNLGPDKKGLC